MNAGGLGTAKTSPQIMGILDSVQHQQQRGILKRRQEIG
jgi:hypothetical protein